MNNNWFKDIMVQKYQCDNYFDPTKLFILMAITEEGVLKKSYSINEISKYVYRYYVSNEEVAKRNFNIIIRNIKKYGIEDIVSVVKSALSQWNREQINNSLIIYDTYISLNMDEYDSKTVSLTRTMTETLFQKYYKTKLKPILDYNSISNYDDSNIYAFNQSLAKTLILEDIQYCPITEETNLENLYAVHIYNKEDGASEEELSSKENIILLSESIANEYLDKKFIFDAFGKIINITSRLEKDNMRLIMNLINDNRTELIIKHNLMI